VVKPSDPGEGDHLPSRRRLDGAGDWRVAAERHVRPVVVIILHVLADRAKQVTLTEDDEVIEQLASKGPNEALGGRGRDGPSSPSWPTRAAPRTDPSEHC
jgi:hypothetical protein